MADYQRCFIENMKFYRNKKGISQAELAEACDVANGTIGNIECGLTKPSFDLILQIADHLGVKPESLFYSAEDSKISKEIPDKFSKEQLKRIRSAFSIAVNEAVENLKK